MAKDNPDPRSETPSKALKGGDYAAGWWGEDAARDGQTVPGPYGQPPEADPEAPDLKKPDAPAK